MALTRPAHIAAWALALLGPALLLWPTTPAVPPPPPIAPPIAIAPPGPRPGRPLFTGTAGMPLPDDAPRLAGIAGRLPADAVALVRGADDRVRSLALGATIDGWTLAALDPGAALFVRGGQRLRIAMPAD